MINTYTRTCEGLHRVRYNKRIRSLFHPTYPSLISILPDILFLQRFAPILKRLYGSVFECSWGDVSWALQGCFRGTWMVSPEKNLDEFSLASFLHS